MAKVCTKTCDLCLCIDVVCVFTRAVLLPDSTVAPASTPEPETVEVDGVQRRVSDSHLFQRIKSDIERVRRFFVQGVGLLSHVVVL